MVITVSCSQHILVSLEELKGTLFRRPLLDQVHSKSCSGTSPKFCSSLSSKSCSSLSSILHLQRYKPYSPREDNCAQESQCCRLHYKLECPRLCPTCPQEPECSRIHYKLECSRLDSTFHIGSKSCSGLCPNSCSRLHSTCGLDAEGVSPLQPLQLLTDELFQLDLSHDQLTGVKAMLDACRNLHQFSFNSYPSASSLPLPLQPIEVAGGGHSPLLHSTHLPGNSPVLASGQPCGRSPLRHIPIPAGQSPVLASGQPCGHSPLLHRSHSCGHIPSPAGHSPGHSPVLASSNPVSTDHHSPDSIGPPGFRNSLALPATVASHPTGHNPALHRNHPSPIDHQSPTPTGPGSSNPSLAGSQGSPMYAHAQPSCRYPTTPPAGLANTPPSGHDRDMVRIFSFS